VQASAQLAKVEAILAGSTANLQWRAPDEGQSRGLYALPDDPHADRPIDRLSASPEEVAKMSMAERIDIDGMRNLIQARRSCLRDQELRAAIACADQQRQPVNDEVKRVRRLQAMMHAHADAARSGGPHRPAESAGER
jgi:hypothetical protein